MALYAERGSDSIFKPTRAFFTNSPRALRITFFVRSFSFLSISRLCVRSASSRTLFSISTIVSIRNAGKGRAGVNYTKPLRPSQAAAGAKTQNYMKTYNSKSNKCFGMKKKFTELNMRYDFYNFLKNGHPPLPPCVGPWGADCKAAGGLTTTLVRT